MKHYQSQDKETKSTIPKYPLAHIEPNEQHLMFETVNATIKEELVKANELRSKLSTEAEHCLATLQDKDFAHFYSTMMKISIATQYKMPRERNQSKPHNRFYVTHYDNHQDYLTEFMVVIRPNQRPTVTTTRPTKPQKNKKPKPRKQFYVEHFNNQYEYQKHFNRRQPSQRTRSSPTKIPGQANPVNQYHQQREPDKANNQYRNTSSNPTHHLNPNAIPFSPQGSTSTVNKGQSTPSSPQKSAPLNRKVPTTVSTSKSKQTNAPRKEVLKPPAATNKQNVAKPKVKIKEGPQATWMHNRDREKVKKEKEQKDDSRAAIPPTTPRTTKVYNSHSVEEDQSDVGTTNHLRKRPEKIQEIEEKQMEWENHHDKPKGSKQQLNVNAKPFAPAPKYPVICAIEFTSKHKEVSTTKPQSTNNTPPISRRRRNKHEVDQSNAWNTNNQHEKMIGILEIGDSQTEWETNQKDNPDGSGTTYAIVSRAPKNVSQDVTRANLTAPKNSSRQPPDNTKSDNKKIKAKTENLGARGTAWDVHPGEQPTIPNNFTPNISRAKLQSPKPTTMAPGKPKAASKTTMEATKVDSEPRCMNPTPTKTVPLKDMPISVMATKSCPTTLPSSNRPDQPLIVTKRQTMLCLVKSTAQPQIKLSINLATNTSSTADNESKIVTTTPSSSQEESVRDEKSNTVTMKILQPQPTACSKTNTIKTMDPMTTMTVSNKNLLASTSVSSPGTPDVNSPHFTGSTTHQRGPAKLQQKAEPSIGTRNINRRDKTTTRKAVNKNSPKKPTQPKAWLRPTSWQSRERSIESKIRGVAGILCYRLPPDKKRVDKIAEKTLNVRVIRSILQKRNSTAPKHPLLPSRKGRKLHETLDNYFTPETQPRPPEVTQKTIARYWNWEIYFTTATQPRPPENSTVCC